MTFGLPSKIACNEYFIDFYSHSNAINVWCMEKMRFIHTANNKSIKKRQFSERRFVTILWQIDVMDVKRLIFVRTAP